MHIKFLLFTLFLVKQVYAHPLILEKSLQGPLYKTLLPWESLRRLSSKRPIRVVGYSNEDIDINIHPKAKPFLSGYESVPQALYKAPEFTADMQDVTSKQTSSKHQASVKPKLVERPIPKNLPDQNASSAVIIPPPPQEVRTPIPPVIPGQSLVKKAPKKLVMNPLIVPPPPPEFSKKKTPAVLVKKVEERKPVYNIADQSAFPFSHTEFYSALVFYQLFARYVFIDNEFTGLGEEHKITEVGAVETINFIPTGNKFGTLVNPGRSVCSAAHKLTGYTQKQLAQYPRFSRIAPRLLRFMDGAVLVFHHAYQDRKFLNRELEYAGLGANKLSEFIIGDTMPIFDKFHPKEKKNLSYAAEEYKVDTSKRSQHGAMLDAEILAQLFTALIRKHGVGVFLPSQWKGVTSKHIWSVYNQLSAKPSDLVYGYLKALGIHSDLPPQFRFSPLYHMDSSSEQDALVIDFSPSVTEPKFLVSYFNIPKQENRKRGQKSQTFFGVAEQAFIQLMGEQEGTVFIGGPLGALLCNEVLTGKQGQAVREAIGVLGQLSIKMCPTTYLMHNVPISRQTQNIFLVLENFDRYDKHLREMLDHYIQTYGVKTFLAFFTMLEQEPDLKRFIVKHNQQDWYVTSDDYHQGVRTLSLLGPSQQKKVITCDDNKNVCAEGEPVFDPNTAVLISSIPDVAVKVICFNYEPGRGEVTLNQTFKNPPPNYAERMMQAASLRTIKDIQFIERMEQARILYAEGAPITPDTPADKYFKKRGITCHIPEIFRTSPRVYNTWVNREMPAILAPLFNQAGHMTGIHEIFCEEDGRPLKVPGVKRRKAPNKVTLGKTVGSITEIYTSRRPLISNSPVEVTVISEGMENALVVKDTMEYLAAHDLPTCDAVHQAFSPGGTFHLVSCIGINGIIDVPVSEAIQTVVILADNDAENTEAKRTMIKTVDHFIKVGKKVLMVLPVSDDQSVEKMDLNDVYINNSETKYRRIADLLIEAVHIKDASDIGPAEEPLQASFLRLKPEKLDITILPPKEKAQEKERRFSFDRRITLDITADVAALEMKKAQEAIKKEKIRKIGSLTLDIPGLKKPVRKPIKQETKSRPMNLDDQYQDLLDEIDLYEHEVFKRSFR